MENNNPFGLLPSLENQAQAIELQPSDLENYGSVKHTIVNNPPDYANEPEPDLRTEADLRNEAISQVVNLFDIPEGLIDQAKGRLTECVERYQRGLLLEVIPPLLALEPAIESLAQSVPLLFSDGGTDISLIAATQPLAAYAKSLALFKARGLLEEAFGFTAEDIDRIERGYKLSNPNLPSKSR